MKTKNIFVILFSLSLLLNAIFSFAYATAKKYTFCGDISVGFLQNGLHLIDYQQKCPPFPTYPFK